MSAPLRLGTGAGFSSDRLQPALDMARHGNLDWLVFETIGERTLAFGHRDRRRNPNKGYNGLLARRMRAVLPLIDGSSCRVITNMGVANPKAAAELTAEIARDLGLRGLRIAWLFGDDVTGLMTPETILWEGGKLGDSNTEVIGANAYLGSNAILPAIATGAQVIITGRVVDPSLFLAPMIAHFGWDLDDLLWEVESLLCCGPAGGGGYRGNISASVVSRSASLDRALVRPAVSVIDI